MNKDELIKLMTDADAKRPRSLQKEIGVSSLGDCRRRVWSELNNVEGTNPTRKLPAILGTAIHAALEQMLKKNKRYLSEVEVKIDGWPPAHVDLYDKEKFEVVDFKTITLKGVNYFMSKQKRWQIQTYAYLMTQAGYRVDNVRLIGIPRDGYEDDVIEWTEPYDESVALEAKQWLTDLESLVEPPAPERDAVSFCARFCEFYGSSCQGIDKDISGEPIVDENVTRAAKQYLDISAQIKKLEADKDAAKLALEGVTGITFEGVKVSWSEIAGRSTPDMDTILNLLQTHVDENMSIPVKKGASSLRLNVKG